MKKLLASVLFSLSLFLFACGQSPLETINGTWGIDTSGASAKSSDPEEAEILQELLQHMGNFQVLVNTKRQKVTIAIPGRAVTGDMTVVSESADTVTLNVDGAQYIFEIKGPDSIILKADTLWKSGLPMKRVK